MPDDNGDELIVLALQPAGQPINDHPLAGEPKVSNSRDDESPAEQQVSVLVGHPLAASVTAALPALVDRAALPDHVVVLSAIPSSGRGRIPDRPVLARLLAELAPEYTQPADPAIDGSVGRLPDMLRRTWR